MSTLHAFLDESGNLTFSAKGTKYYVFAAAWTLDPAPMARDLARLRFDYLKQGHDLTRFHAAEDMQVHRNAVIDVLLSYHNWLFAALVVEKAKINPVLREPHVFYPRFASMVFRFVFKNTRWKTTTDRVLAFTDRLPVKKHREAVAAAFKRSCRQDLRDTPFNLYHHPGESNYWLQVADYCVWAVQRKWEQQDRRSYDRLARNLAMSELDVLRHGDTRYY